MSATKPTIDGYIAPNGDWIVEGDKFIYEISVYKIFKDRAECHGSKFIYSNNPITIKKKAIYKRRNNYIIGKFIDWLKAPKDYIIKNHLKKLELNVRKSKRKSKV